MGGGVAVGPAGDCSGGQGQVSRLGLAEGDGRLLQVCSLRGTAQGASQTAFLQVRGDDMNILKKLALLIKDLTDATPPRQNPPIQQNDRNF